MPSNHHLKEGHNDLMCGPSYVHIDDWDCNLGDWPERIFWGPNLSPAQARDVLWKAQADLTDSFQPEYQI